MSRIIIFTGKGGVGKSSIAAAHAVKSAQRGYKTLIVSTDMAHNLADIFNVKLGTDPAEVIPDKLDALEIDPNYEMSTHYNSIGEAIKKMIPSGSNGNTDIIDEMTVVPGMDELFSLIRIQSIYESGKYDNIIVDCAPTGETLALLKFPELLSWYMEKLFPFGKLAMKFLRPVSKTFFRMEMPDKKAMNDIEKLYVNLNSLQNLLKDREICSIRIVAMPEKMVVEESKRSYMYLNLYNFNVDGVYINRVLPEDAGEFFSQWKETQKKHISELEAAFSHLPITKVKWYQTDINGLDGVRRIAEDSLNAKDLFDVRSSIGNEIFEKTEDGYSLRLYLPFADRSSLDMFETGTDLIIKSANFKRCVPLPNILVNSSVTGAKFEDDFLIITFERRQ